MKINKKHINRIINGALVILLILCFVSAVFPVPGKSDDISGNVEIKKAGRRACGFSTNRASMGASFAPVLLSFGRVRTTHRAGRKASEEHKKISPGGSEKPGAQKARSISRFKRTAFLAPFIRRTCSDDAADGDEIPS